MIMLFLTFAVCGSGITLLCLPKPRALAARINVA